MLTAIGVVLQGVLTIPGVTLGVYTFNIGFGALPAILSGILFGPLFGAIVAALTDLIQALLFPVGAFNPIFTVSAALFGLIPGLFFLRRAEPLRFLRVLIAVLVGQVISSVVVNTAVISLLYGVSWQSLVSVRLLNQAVMIPLYTVIIYFLLTTFERYKVIK
jgi:ECF transporter S component (folate family)